MVLPTKIAVSGHSIFRVRRVLHLGKNRVHYWKSEKKSICGFWTCGSPESPSESARFGSLVNVIPRSAETCRPCASRLAKETGWSAEREDVPDDKEVEASLSKGPTLPEVPSSSSAESSENEQAG